LSALLEVERLRAGYGRIEVLHEISLRLEAHTLCAIVGANGAGKTTLLMALSRLVARRAGRIVFDGRDLSRAASHQVVRAGMIHVPEGRRVLAAMSVQENLLVAGQARPRRELHRDLDEMYERFPILGARRALAAGSLSGGEQQLLAIARGLIAKPKALLLDEPSMGLAPQVVEEIFEIVRSLNEREGVSFLLAEQNANIALNYARFGYILETGRVVLDGAAEALRDNEDVREFYLGVSGAGRRSFKHGKTYKRRKRWLA